MSSRNLSGQSHRGFTLIEMITVSAIVVTGLTVAIPVTMRMVNNAKGDTSLVLTETFLKSARNRAVAERRNIVLTFVSDKSLQAERVNVVDGTTVVVDTLLLEGDQKFIRDVALPDTPDRFGGTDPINFTGTQPVMFTSDGSLIDAAGDVTNGTIYLAREGMPETARAVSIWGMTGLLRSWKWRGNAWMQ